MVTAVHRTVDNVQGGQEALKKWKEDQKKNKKPKKR